MLVILLCLLAVTPAALPKTRARSDVFTQLFRSIRKVPLHAAQRAMVLFGWNEKAR